VTFDLAAGGFCGVVLAGGTAARMDGVDKAGVELAGRTLLEYAVDAFLDADEVVVVAPRSVPTSRPVTFVCEAPPRGGPVAGLLTGVDALLRRPRLVGVLAARWPERVPLPRARPVREIGLVNLHDWIDELSDVLDVETEVDEGLILDLARTAAQNVQKTAAPITTYLLGVAAGAGDADPETIEKLAARAQQLAESWDRPADAPDPDDVDDEVPDDSSVDHSADLYED